MSGYKRKSHDHETYPRTEMNRCDQEWFSSDFKGAHQFISHYQEPHPPHQKEPTKKTRDEEYQYLSTCKKSYTYLKLMLDPLIAPFLPTVMSDLIIEYARETLVLAPPRTPINGHFILSLDSTTSTELYVYLKHIVDFFQKECCCIFYNDRFAPSSSIKRPNVYRHIYLIRVRHCQEAQTNNHNLIFLYDDLGLLDPPSIVKRYSAQMLGDYLATRLHANDGYSTIYWNNDNRRHPEAIRINIVNDDEFNSMWSTSHVSYGMGSTHFRNAECWPNDPDKRILISKTRDPCIDENFNFVPVASYVSVVDSRLKKAKYN